MTNLPKILIIDDEIHIRTLLVQTLEELSDDDEAVILDPCCDGEEGLSAIIKHKPEIIIMDLMMPKLNGFQVYQIMREQNISTNSKLIMISAKSQLSDIEKAKNMQIETYITKPFDPDTIIDKVRELL